MFDGKAPSSVRVEEELKKKGVVQDLFALGTRRTGSEADAKDLVLDALVRVMDPEDAPWEPEKHTFLSHMAWVMRQVRYRQGRKRGATAVVLDGGLAQETTANEGPRADDEVDERRSLAVQRTLGARLLARLGSDLLARELYELAMKEDVEPADAAKRLNRDPAEIKAAHQRLRYHGQRVLEEWNLSEERRMNALREEARTQTDEGTP